MTKEATVEQLSIFDEIERQDVAAATADDSLDGYQTRYERGELLPGERGPGCGHIFVRGGYDGSRCHRVHEEAAGLICAGMRLTRRHLAIALSDDPQWQGFAHGDEAQRAIAAGWPESTVSAWQADPRELPHELHSPSASHAADSEEGMN